MLATCHTNDRRERRPPFEYASGAVYEGEWINDVRDGFGVLTWSDGTKYAGAW